MDFLDSTNSYYFQIILNQSSWFCPQVWTRKPSMVDNVNVLDISQLWYRIFIDAIINMFSCIHLISIYHLSTMHTCMHLIQWPKESKAIITCTPLCRRPQKPRLGAPARWESTLPLCIHAHPKSSFLLASPGSQCAQIHCTNQTIATATNIPPASRDFQHQLVLSNKKSSWSPTLSSLIGIRSIKNTACIHDLEIPFYSHSMIAIGRPNTYTYESVQSRTEGTVLPHPDIMEIEGCQGYKDIPVSL